MRSWLCCWAVVANKRAPQVGALMGLLAAASAASAQPTWSAQRERPSLFEIIAVDATAQNGWPYGREDTAGDGAQTFEADEAAVDLRSVYADTNMRRLWLRAYVAATVQPSMKAVAFFFIDTDARSSTGGAAEGTVLWPAFDDDPSPGGYERAVGIRGDGTLLGAYDWDAAAREWTKQMPTTPQVVRETGVARDPLRLAGDDHGYFQVDLDLPGLLSLGEACDATIFVRLWNDATGARSFGDTPTVMPCKARLDRYGDPEILRSATCDDDASCPARGECQDDRCVLTYECKRDSDCRSGERCESDVCRASDGGVDRGDAPDAGAAGSGGPRVRGGAFTCSAQAPSGGDAGKHCAWLGIGALFIVGSARARARARQRGDR